MNTFNKYYFSSLYQSPKDKSSQKKLQAYMEIIHRNIPADRNGMLLDIGCGYGHFLQRAERLFTTYGIDPSAYALDYARKIAKHTIFEKTTMRLYRSRVTFDVITAFDILEHTSNVDLSLRKIKSLLKPRGIAVCVVPIYDGVFGGIGGMLDRDPTHVQKLSRWRWLELFQKYFTIVEKQGAVRYSFPGDIYFHVMFPWLFRWGQAILVVMKKR